MPTLDDVRWLHDLARRPGAGRVRYRDLVDRGFTLPERAELATLLGEGVEFETTQSGELFVRARSFWDASMRIAARQGRTIVH